MSDEVRQHVFAHLVLGSQIMFLTSAVSVTGIAAISEARQISLARTFLLQSLIQLSSTHFHYPGLIFPVRSTVRLASLHIDLQRYTEELLGYYSLQAQDRLVVQSWVGRLFRVIDLHPNHATTPFLAVCGFLFVNRNHPVIINALKALLFSSHLQVFCCPYPCLNRARFLLVFSYKGNHGHIFAEDLLWDPTVDVASDWEFVN